MGNGVDSSRGKETGSPSRARRRVSPVQGASWTFGKEYGRYRIFPHCECSCRSFFRGITDGRYWRSSRKVMFVLEISLFIKISILKNARFSTTSLLTASSFSLSVSRTETCCKTVPAPQAWAMAASKKKRQRGTFCVVRIVRAQRLRFCTSEHRLQLVSSLQYDILPVSNRRVREDKKILLSPIEFPCHNADQARQVTKWGQLTAPCRDDCCQFNKNAGC